MKTRFETVKLRKEYPGTVALDDVSMQFSGGAIHALIGKNGAGKSTLVKILSGAVQPTAGEIRIDGRSVAMQSPAHAFSMGIATVYQELSLVPELTVAENIFLGRLPRRRGLFRGLIDWQRIFAEAESLFQQLGVEIDVRAPIRRLGVAAQQLVEIAKAMSFAPAVLLLDEPTSALARHESESLFALLRSLAASGVTILYISHRLQELPALADTVSVLRDGRHAGTLPMQEATPHRLAELMFGQTTEVIRPAHCPDSDETVLAVKNLTRAGKFAGVSFRLQKGEILGIAGMLGAGRTELLRAIFAADAFDSGAIIVHGTAVRADSPARMKNAGIAYTPEDRKSQGLIQVLSVRQNMTLAGLEKLAPHGWITRRREARAVRPRIDALHMQVADIELPVGVLSGGNQQKVVVGNWLATEPRILLFDEPTRGIDVQAKQQIFQIIWDLSRRGISSIFVSSELEELLEVCHRILIMRSGKLVGAVRPDEVTLQELLALCMGA